MFTYKTYVASCHYNFSDDLLEGRVLGIMDEVIFKGADLKTFLSNFYDAVDKYEENSKLLTPQVVLPLDLPTA